MWGTPLRTVWDWKRGGKTNIRRPLENTVAVFMVKQYFTLVSKIGNPIDVG